MSDWRIDLIGAHCRLFHPPPDAPAAAQGYPHCGDGWCDSSSAPALGSRRDLSSEPHSWCYRSSRGSAHLAFTGRASSPLDPSPGLSMRWLCRKPDLIAPARTAGRSRDRQVLQYSAWLLGNRRAVDAAFVCGPRPDSGVEYENRRFPAHASATTAIHQASLDLRPRTKSATPLVGTRVTHANRADLTYRPRIRIREIPMSIKRAARNSPNRPFVSVKTSTAIPVPHPALRHALVRVSLNPQVRSIDYVAEAIVASEQVDIDAIVVQRDDSSFLLDVVPARRIRDVDDEGLALIALAQLRFEPWIITAEELRREPRYTNAKLVWSYSQHRAPIDFRMRIQALLEEKSIQLGRLIQTVRDNSDPSPAILALACADLLELDLVSQPLGPKTIVKSRA